MLSFGKELNPPFSQNMAHIVVSAADLYLEGTI